MLKIDVVRSVAALRAVVRPHKHAGRKIGLVPTMGALHQGHLELVKTARRMSDFVVATIFVNPLQFNQAADLDAYPRDEATDLNLLAATGTDLVFAPSVAEMYPQGFATQVRVGGLTDHLDGPARPGHFEGVATVVTKLFNRVEPDLACEGGADVDDPSSGMRGEALCPGDRLRQRQRAASVTAHSEHAMNVRIAAEADPRLYVGRLRRAQRDRRGFENGNQRIACNLTGLSKDETTPASDKNTNAPPGGGRDGVSCLRDRAGGLSGGFHIFRTVGLAQHPEPVALPVTRIARERVLPRQAVPKVQVDMGPGLPRGQVTRLGVHELHGQHAVGLHGHRPDEQLLGHGLLL